LVADAPTAAVLDQRFACASIFDDLRLDAANVSALDVDHQRPRWS
jgi:hypothetical protein